MSSNRNGPEPGDLIEISYHLHTHWALYVGNGYVVHLTPIGTKFPEINEVHIELSKDTPGVVQKELLTIVAAGYKYKVNNKHDEKKQPLCAKEIVQRAEAQVGKEMPYNFKNCSSEHFATELRYEVPLPDKNRIGPQPKPGDLIEIFRNGYEHWAVYVGDGYVIHLTFTEHGDLETDLNEPESCLSLIAMVKKEPLTKVTAGCKYRVNNKYDKKIKPLPAKKIISEAEKLVGKKMSYNLLTNNCEHFATKLRYEDPRCGQLLAQINCFLPTVSCVPQLGEPLGQQCTSTSQWPQVPTKVYRQNLIGSMLHKTSSIHWSGDPLRPEQSSGFSPSFKGDLTVP